MKRVFIILAVVALGLVGVYTVSNLSGAEKNIATEKKTDETEKESTDVIAATKISPADAQTVLNQDSQHFLIDVRTAEEFAVGHIRGATLIPYDKIETLAALDSVLPSTPVIVYCQTGGRSAVAAEKLTEMGYTEVYDLGGIADWPYEIVTDDAE